MGGKKSNDSKPVSQKTAKNTVTEECSTVPAKATAKEPETKKNDADVSPKLVSTGRKADLFFVLTYTGWFVAMFVLFFSRCEHLLPSTFQGAEFAKPVCAALAQLEGPLAPLLESHKQWGDKMFSVADDFTLKLVHSVNLAFLGPVALLLALGFLLRTQWTKNIAIIHATIMLYNMVVLDTYAYKVLHDPKSSLSEVDAAAAKLLACIIYGYFTIFPLVVLKRMWSVTPFAPVAQKRSSIFSIAGLFGMVSFFIKFGLFLWMMATVVGFYEFSVKHTASLKHLPSVVDTSVESWEQTAPHREQLMIRAAEFQVGASVVLKEYYAEAKVQLEKLGNRVLEWANNLAKKDETAAKEAPKAAPKATKPAPPKKPEAPKAETKKPEAPKAETKKPEAPKAETKAAPTKA